MSLQGKIVAWFVFFAALTVLVFGLGDYTQATDALRVTLQSRVNSMALQVATESDRHYEAQRSELVALASAASIRALDTLDIPRIAQFSRVRVRAGGRTVLERGPLDAPPQAGGCGQPSVDYSFRFLNPLRQPVDVDASLPAAAFFKRVPPAGLRIGARGITALLGSSSGAVIRDVGCQLAQASPELVARLGAEALAPPPADSFSARPVHLQLRGDAWPIAAMAAAPRAGWTVAVLADEGEFAAPFIAARLKYLGPVALAILIAALIVLNGIRRDLRRLSAMARAADDIGRGRFDVWLPPPTGDEVGRVSLALGRMVDRLSNSIRQIEITRAMAAVGELSAYLSHEIRNPLSSIGLNLQMLRRELASGPAPEDTLQLLDLSLTDLRRLDGVVKAVLQFARTAPDPSRGICRLNETTREAVEVMRRKLDEAGIVVQLELCQDEVAAPIDPAALKGLLLNLLVNSADALAEAADRRIVVQTELNADPDGNSWAVLSVRDTGPGVPPHLRQRIFDPFFTTKATGNGIGLSTALRAAQECGGSLRYAPSAESTGAEFILELPLTRAEPDLVRYGHEPFETDAVPQPERFANA